MAKTRAQRKAEQRRRATEGVPAKRDAESRAQRRTQMPETAENVAVQPHMMSADAVAVVAEDDGNRYAFEGEDRLWSRSREFDWGD